jgi:hypothetical protein
MDIRVMIHAGEIEPGTELLINDSGRYILRSGDQSVEVNGNALAAALERTRQVADLVTRSAVPVSGISGPVEQSLAHFGCSVERT